MAVCLSDITLKPGSSADQSHGQFIKFGANWVKVVGVFDQCLGGSARPEQTEEKDLRVGIKRIRAPWKQ
jgi:hypothetical protein